MKNIPVTIAAASTNQTAWDWTNNLGNIFAAIDEAIDNKVDILGFQELTLTGYDCGDLFYYTSNDQILEMLQAVADYAAAKDPNLVISVGHPYFYAEKNRIDTPQHPLFNRKNKPFNCQSVLTGGDIVAMQVKGPLADRTVEYEPRHFQEWNPDIANDYASPLGPNYKGHMGAIEIQLPAIRSELSGTLGLTVRNIPPRKIPFGDVVVNLKGQDGDINLYQPICEMLWVGQEADGATPQEIVGNPLYKKSRFFDISLAMVPNGSNPGSRKIGIRQELLKAASKYAKVTAYTAGLGSSGSTFAEEGDIYFAQKGKITDVGQRFSFADMSMIHQTFNIPAARDKGIRPHVTIKHNFKPKAPAKHYNLIAEWEKNPSADYEERLRYGALYLFDYMRKTGLQTVMNALSGGNDSAYSAVLTSSMIEMACNELGIEGFFLKMPHLSYKDEVLDVYKQHGAKAAVQAIKDNMMVLVYMGTDNSSAETEQAARTLVEGGTLPDGTKVEGIGGRYYYRNVQHLVDNFAATYSGVNYSELPAKRREEITQQIADIIKLKKGKASEEDVAKQAAAITEISHRVLSWAHESDGITLENIQARTRMVLNWVFANAETGCLALANPNLDEAEKGYTTFGGDLHSGTVNLTGHKRKHHLIKELTWLYKHGSEVLKPIKSLHYVLANEATAELQQLDDDGKTAQSDEEAMGIKFDQMMVLSRLALHTREHGLHDRKLSPIEVFNKIADHPLFKDEPIDSLHRKVEDTYGKWFMAQFKIHSGPITPTFGENVDHQSSVRTPNISSNLRVERTQLALHALSCIAHERGESLQDLAGIPFDQLHKRAMIDPALQDFISRNMWDDEKAHVSVQALYEKTKTTKLAANNLTMRPRIICTHNKF